MSKNAILIYSGGMDSTVMLHNYQNIIGLALYFFYGSKHNQKERAMAIENCRKLDIPFLSLDVREVFRHFNSSLLNPDEPIPHGHFESEIMKKTIVPFRNGIMLSIASGIAESQGFKTIMLGNHAGDRAIYPDCRPEFIFAMETALRIGTGTEIEIYTPYMYLTKKEIAILGQVFKVDFNLTWTCYEGGETPCGKCGACVERNEAFQ